jgi:hypothetical protein
MAVYEYLTLSDSEASALVDAFNGHWFDPASSLDPRDELTLGLQDAGEIDGLSPKWGVKIDQLVVRIAGLSADQAQGVVEAVQAFWDSSLPLTREALSDVGLV